MGKKSGAYRDCKKEKVKQQQQQKKTQAQCQIQPPDITNTEDKRDKNSHKLSILSYFHLIHLFSQTASALIVVS